MVGSISFRITIASRTTRDLINISNAKPACGFLQRPVVSPVGIYALVDPGCRTIDLSEPSRAASNIGCIVQITRVCICPPQEQPVKAYVIGVAKKVAEVTLIVYRHPGKFEFLSGS